MKKLFLAAAALFVCGTVRAGSVVYSSNLANEPALAVNNTYSLDLGSSNLRNSNVDSLSAQAIYAQAAPSASTFVDGVASTASITVSSMTALHGVAATNRLTLLSNSLAGTAASVQVNVASNTYLAANNVSLYLEGISIISNISYVVGASSSTTATNLAAAVSRVSGFSAAASGSTVTISCSLVGTANNGKPISTSASTRLVVSASTFTGGINNVFFTLNGVVMTQGVQWSVGASSGATGYNIVQAVNAYAPLSGRFVASTSSSTAPGIVNLTVISTGTAGNAYTLTSSSAALLSARSATFTGGINAGVLAFNINGTGVTLVEGTDWQAITSSQATITSIKAAIDGNATLTALISVSTATGGVANLTAKGVGASTNYGIMVSSPTALTVTNKRMFGGVDSDISTTANTITETSHGFSTGLALLYTKTAGTSPANLNAGTTYYAIRVTANSYKVATSTTNAVAGTAVSISSQVATGGGTFVFTPLAYTGTASFKWQESNDASNWNDISVSSVTYSSPSTSASSTFWDFGSVNYRYLRLNVVAPTRGGLYLVVPVLGKSNN